MGSTLAPSPNNLLLGRGNLYFSRFDTSGNPTGELHLGNCEMFEITPSVEFAEKNSAMDKTAGTYKQVPKHVTYDINIKGDEFSKENMALAFLGDTTAFTQGSGTVTAEVVTTVVKKGRWFPLKYRNVSSVVVKGGVSGTTAMTAGTDYTVDTVSGRIQVLATGTFADADTMKVDYSYSAITSNKITAGTSPLIEGFLRYIANNAAGPTHEVQVWRVQLSGDGAIGFITDDFSDFTLKGKVLTDLGNHPSSPYFDMIEL